jgi:putative DNA primase/helicase
MTNHPATTYADGVPSMFDDTPHPADDAGRVLLPNSEPRMLADHYIRERGRDKTGRLTLRRWNEQFWRWDGSAYQVLSKERVQAEIRELLERVLVPKVRGNEVVRDEQGDVVFAPIKVRIRLIAEVAAAAATTDALVETPVPGWLDGRKEPAPAELVACRNGLLHLPTRTLGDSTPRYFNTGAVPLDFASTVEPPTRWLAFLDQLWPDDEQIRETLQMMFGYLLTPDTRQQKIFLLVGPRRSGKGTIARVLTHVLGVGNVCGPTLTSMQGEFGLQPLIGTLCAIIADARLSGRADQAIIAERLLSISGEDLLTINRKNQSMVSMQLSTRIVILTNELPRLGDASGALSSRFILIPFTESYLGRENLNLSDELLAELPQIFGWSVDGWYKLREAGHLTQPEASAETLQELEDLASPIGAFVRSRCSTEPGARVPCSDLFVAWKSWCEEQGRREPGTQASFARNLRAAIPRLSTRQVRGASDRYRVYEGVQLVDAPQEEMPF